MGCSGSGEEEVGSTGDIHNQEQAIMLGPRDGRDLPATELDRVAVETMAPDFSLATLSGDTVTLSEFRGARNVVLVFYRGHW